MQNVHVGFACPNSLTLEVPPAYGTLHRLIIGDSLQMKEKYGAAARQARTRY